MGWHHADQLVKDGRARLIAIYDRSSTAATALADATSSRQSGEAVVVCPGLDQLWNRHDVDGVIICSPTGEHFAQVQQAWLAGWHVLCEKPLTTTSRHLQQLLEDTAAGRLGGRTFTIGYQRRYWSVFRTARQLIVNRTYGDLRAMEMVCCEDWQSTITGTWRDDPAQNPGGFIADAGSHKLDMLQFLTQRRVRWLQAHHWLCGSQVPINTAVFGALDGDLPLSLSFVGYGHRLAEEYTIHCEQADLLIRDQQLFLVQSGTVDELPLTEPHSEPVCGWLDTILDEAENLSPIATASDLAAITTAIEQSHATGLAVQVGRLDG
jgi:predicted dehydrogenase